MLRLTEFQLSDKEEEGDIPKLQAEELRSKWRDLQIKNQKYQCAAIDSTWRQKQVKAASGSNTQSTFSELVVLGLGDYSSSAEDFFSSDSPKWVDGLSACDKGGCVQSAQAPTPCLSGWLSKKKESSIAFMTPFSRWRKSWFVVTMEPDSLILNRYDTDTFSTPTKATALDLGQKARREQALDGSDRFCFSVLIVDSRARIVLAGDSKAQADNWVATLNSVIAEMRPADTQTACSQDN